MEYPIFTVGPSASPQFIATMEQLVGQPVVRVSSEQAEKASCVLCVCDTAPGGYLDDVHTVCADCRVGIRHRLQAPKRPPKLCWECVQKRMRSTGTGR